MKPVRFLLVRAWFASLTSAVNESVFGYAIDFSAQFAFALHMMLLFVGSDVLPVVNGLAWD
jgi:hypothetical protein